MILGRALLRYHVALAAIVSLSLASRLFADERPGVVSHVKVVSDKVEDVSSLEAWKEAFIKPGMTDQQKALAVWESVVKFRHQDSPPNEFLSNPRRNVHDPIKSFNVYGYGMCSCASANIEQLARFAGLQARGWGITGHSVPEINIDGHWCMFDASLINYFRKPDGHDRQRGGDQQEHRRLVHEAPRVSRRTATSFCVHARRKVGSRDRQSSPAAPGTTTNGWLPAATHGWYSSMQEFNEKKNFQYEYGAAVGYEVNIQLRAGERLSPQLVKQGPARQHARRRRRPDSLTGVAGKGDPPLQPEVRRPGAGADRQRHAFL